MITKTIGQHAMNKICFLGQKLVNQISISQKRNIIKKMQNQIEWNFSLMDKQNCRIDCIVIQNNIVINLPWLKKSLKHTENVVLADGGANIFYQSGLGYHEKVQGIVGDLDSLKPHVRQFYQNRGVKIQPINDQDKNDFEKTVQWIVNKGWKTIFAFGSFGGRLDHTLATISNAQKLIHKFPQIEIVLLGKTNLMCILRGNLKHRVILSEDINHKGCGIISFNKAQHVQTSGFRWNLGKNYVYHSLEWGKFLSTSNQVMNNEVTIQTFRKQSNLNFVSTFINQF